MWCPRSLKSLSAMRGFFVSIIPYFCLMEQAKDFKKSGRIPWLNIAVDLLVPFFEKVLSGVGKWKTQARINADLQRQINELREDKFM